MAKRVYRETQLSRYLKTKRLALGLSTTDVETLTKGGPPEFKISQGFIWQIERGAVPSPYKLLSLARVYGVTLSEVYRHLGAQESEICGHSDGSTVRLKVPPENVSFFEMLNYILSSDGERASGIKVNIRDIYAAAKLQALNSAREGTAPG
jgi:transcriptional regulator with XRE-family HTH domain